ncbi:hypothetical protein P171DRAFT_444354 [Karstenula rhodostoma CBS 690.94]|uniref:Heterokaryon incompatibility domain-containing protein n=1 Tax=Karstenula rhodostoma CBS 690.94 TaxID=1392251 RepID=A0A9P4PJP4_9PLEO|nr:hypothetical protein P171DRAFT_444354 [Karstenula rhodostoma CBS 690.94]
MYDMMVAIFESKSSITAQDQPQAPLKTSRNQLVKPHSKQIWNDKLLESWSTRALTFQEGFLSRRILYFSHDSVRWACRTCAWSEETDSPNCWASHGTSMEQRQRTDSPKLTSLPLPILREYSDLVNGFNCSGLTFPEDVLSAFAGVSTELGRKFTGGLISGLPAFFFDPCLLWQPLRRQGPAKRRLPKADAAASMLPSWSWAGWATEMTWPYTWVCTEDPTGPSPVIIGRIRPFYKTEFYYSVSNGDRTRIPSDWLRYAAAGMDETVSGSLVPLHKTILPPRLADKIHFRSMVGHCKLGQQRRSMTQVPTLGGHPAGTLWQHDEDDPRYIDAVEHGTPIELVVILGCTVSKDDYSWWEEPQVPDYLGVGEDAHEPGRLLEIYNVLWIRRKGDCALRMGSGEVVRSVWDEVVLGSKSDLTLM